MGHKPSFRVITVWWDKIHRLESLSRGRQGPSFHKPISWGEVILESSVARGLPVLRCSLPLFPLSWRDLKCRLLTTSINITWEPENFWAPTQTHWIRNPILIAFQVILCVLKFENHSSIWRVPYTFSRSTFFLQLFCERWSEPWEGITHTSLGENFVPDDQVSKAPEVPHAEHIIHPRASFTKYFILSSWWLRKSRVF